MLVTEEELRAKETVCIASFVFLLILLVMITLIFYLIYSFFPQERIHYEGVMHNKVLPDIKEAEAHYEALQRNRQVSVCS